MKRSIVVGLALLLVVAGCSSGGDNLGWRPMSPPLVESIGPRATLSGAVSLPEGALFFGVVTSGPDEDPVPTVWPFINEVMGDGVPLGLPGEGRPVVGDITAVAGRLVAAGSLEGDTGATPALWQAEGLDPQGPWNQIQIPGLAGDGNSDGGDLNPSGGLEGRLIGISSFGRNRMLAVGMVRDGSTEQVVTVHTTDGQSWTTQVLPDATGADYPREAVSGNSMVVVATVSGSEPNQARSWYLEGGGWTGPNQLGAGDQSDVSAVGVLEGEFVAVGRFDPGKDDDREPSLWSWRSFNGRVWNDQPIPDSAYASSVGATTAVINSGLVFAQLSSGFPGWLTFDTQPEPSWRQGSLAQARGVSGIVQTSQPMVVYPGGADGPVYGYNTGRTFSLLSFESGEFQRIAGPAAPNDVATDYASTSVVASDEVIWVLGSSTPNLTVNDIRGPSFEGWVVTDAGVKTITGATRPGTILEFGVPDGDGIVVAGTYREPTETGGWVNKVLIGRISADGEYTELAAPETPSGANLGGLYRVDDLWWAVGTDFADGLKGVVWTSPDARTWTRLEGLPPANTFWGVCKVGDQLLLVGQLLDGDEYQGALWAQRDERFEPLAVQPQNAVNVTGCIEGPGGAVLQGQVGSKPGYWFLGEDLVPEPADPLPTSVSQTSLIRGSDAWYLVGNTTISGRSLPSVWRSVDGRSWEQLADAPLPEPRTRITGAAIDANGALIVSVDGFGPGVFQLTRGDKPFVP